MPSTSTSTPTPTTTSAAAPPTSTSPTRRIPTLAAGGRGAAHPEDPRRWRGIHGPCRL
jgi:hypothetical protein